MAKLSLHQIRRENAQLVLEAIARKKNITKLEISEETGLSLMTVGKLVSALNTGGIISKSMSESQKVGRHAEIFRVRHDWLIPVFEIAGISPPSPPVTGPLRPKALGMEGPVISASRMAVFISLRRMVTASMEVTMDFPTPPLPLTTPITFLTLLEALQGSIRLTFFDEQLLLQLEQSCVHSCSDITVFSVPTSFSVKDVCFLT